MADVARGEHAGHARFQIVRGALQGPARRKLLADDQVGAGDEITVFVANDADVLCPIGLWHAADADEQPMGWDAPLLPECAIDERDLVECVIAVNAVTSVRGSTSTFGAAWMRSIRYFDSVCVSESSRTTMEIRFAEETKCIAACPAELPPPTMYTCSSFKSDASLAPAP